MDELLSNDVARFARTLANSFAKGTPLVKALDDIADTSEGAFHGAITKIRADVSQGIQLNYTMKQTGLFPDTVVDQVAVSEKVGKLDYTFAEIAAHYEGLGDSG
jgi:type IV pilus assembly protein PilC